LTIDGTAYNGSSALTVGNTIKFLSGGTATAASSSSGTYYPNKWSFNASLTPTNGMIVCIEMPNGGHDYGTFMSVNNGTNYYPIIRNGNSRLTTHYGSGT